MKILHLDDDDLRHELFAEWCRAEGHEPFHARTFDEFGDLLASQDFDEVFLDHDLNDFQYESVVYEMYGEKRLTGAHAAQLMTGLNPEKRPKRIVVHSWNDSGGKRIAAILRENGFTNIHIEPFPQIPFYERLVKWQEEGKTHKFMDIGTPQETLKRLKGE
jgi:hypothetical protein